MLFLSDGLVNHFTEECVRAVRMIIPQPLVALQIRTQRVGALEQLVEDVLYRLGLLPEDVAGCESCCPKST